MNKLLIALASLALCGLVSAQTAYRTTVQTTDLMGLRFFPQHGGFQFDGVQIAFPKEVEGGYALELRKVGGASVYRVGLNLEGVGGFPAFGWLAPQERSDNFKITDSGKYELAVRAGNQDLSVLAFEAKATDNGDPLNPGKSFRLNGPWDKLAYLYAKDGDPKATLHVAGWVIDSEFGKERDDHWVTVQISKGSSVLCKSVVFVDAPHWARYRFDVASPKTNVPCTIADLRKSDGAYALEFRSKTKLLRKFNFNVKGGQITRMPRNTLQFMASNSGGIPPKLVNSEQDLLEMFWFEASK
jgi:hypothetical protein